MVPSVLSIFIAILTPDTNNSLKKACTIRNDLISHSICPHCQWVEYHKDDSSREYQVACESVECHFYFPPKSFGMLRWASTPNATELFI